MSQIEEKAQTSQVILGESSTDRFESVYLSATYQTHGLNHSDQLDERLEEQANALRADWDASHLASTLEEVIGRYEQLLALRPPGHPQRRQTVSDLGVALWRICFYHSLDKARADCCIVMLREALHLCPPGHPLRDKTLHDLAVALFFTTFQQLGDEEALAESVILNREALTLRPPGHPSRFGSLNNLASALGTRFEYCGDFDLLEDTIRMHREVLELCPLGHPMRHSALGNLSGTLMLSFEQQGSFETVTEAIALAREAVDLCPIGHPHRFWALANLAISLALRFIYQGFSVCLAEAMELYREVLNTMPAAHPQRGMMMTNYGDISLLAFQEHGDSCLLSETIVVLREALTLLPEGVQFHDVALNNLAGALVASSEQSGDISLLPEAATLHQKALKFRTSGHPRRIESLDGLADLCCRIEPVSWKEAHTLYCEALSICPQGYPVRAQLLSGMERCFLDASSPFFDPVQGISHLSGAYTDNFTRITQRLRAASSDMRNVEATYASVTRQMEEATRSRYETLVLELYSQIIGILPLAANFGIDHKARLRAVAGTDRIARNAASRAMLVGSVPMAIETLEEGRGVFWTQTLHLRTTASDGVPVNDREELQRLLLLLDGATHEVKTSEPSAAQRERELGRRRHLNEQAQSHCQDPRLSWA
jgi:tetratricopeptide (TPR) repeat protein